MFWTVVNCIGWKFILGIIIGAIIILWISSGGKSYPFLGLNATKEDSRKINHLLGEPTSKYTEDTERSNISETENSKNTRNQERIIHDPIDCTPVIPETILQDVQLDAKRKMNRGKTEQMCRSALEDIYGVPFAKCRPKFLSNPESGCNLELDCYNDELKIGLEYNGIQHYSWPNYTNCAYEDFIEQLRRDKYKVDQCDKNGVYLISVPYNVPPSKIRRYIEYYIPENVLKREKGTP